MSFDHDGFRVNWQIRVPQVRLIKDDKQLGVVNTEKARKIAEELGLDLVEVAPEAKPPVCKIIDFGRFKYEQQIKNKELIKKQKESQVQLKELRLRPTIEKHDIEVKVAQAKKFLEDGMKVQLNLLFRGQRETSHKEQGFKVINNMIKSLEECCIVDRTPKFDGSKIICRLSPKKN
jgi:translation initiation factor IF-3